MNTRTTAVVCIILLLTASLALANPYDTRFDKWAQGGCERAMKTGSLQGITPQGKQEWRKPMSTQRVVTYVSTYVGKQVQEGVNHNDAQMDLLRQQLVAAGSLPKGLPNRMNSDTGETGLVDMKPPTDAAALGSTGTGGPGAPAPAGGGPAAAAPPPPAATPPAGGPGAAAPPAPATSNMAGELGGITGLWGKAIDNPIPTCVILLMLGFAGHMWQKRRT